MHLAYQEGGEQDLGVQSTLLKHWTVVIRTRICRLMLQFNRVFISLRTIRFGDRFLAERYYDYSSERYFNCLTMGVQATERMVQLEVFEKDARISYADSMCHPNVRHPNIRIVTL